MLKDALGKVEVVHGLGVVTEREAAKEAYRLDLKYDALFDGLRKGSATLTDAQRVAIKQQALNIDPKAIYRQEADKAWDRMAEAMRAKKPLSFDIGDAARTLIHVAETGDIPAPSFVTVAMAYQVDLERYGPRRDEALIARCIRRFDKGLDIRKITRDEVLAFVKEEKDRGVSDGTVKRELASIQGVFSRWFQDQSLPVPAIFGRIKLKTAGADARLPLHSSHIAKLLGYLEESKRVQPTTRRLLWFLLHSGTIVSEAACLQKRDIVLNDDVPHFIVRQNAWNEGLKTAARERTIPLVGLALKAAKEALEKPVRGEYLWFSERPDTTYISNTLVACMRRSGIPRSPRLVVYSMRHGLLQAARDAGGAEHLVREIAGHARASVHARYGAAKSQLKALLPVMEGALRHLGDVAESQFEQWELELEASP